MYSVSLNRGVLTPDAYGSSTSLNSLTTLAHPTCHHNYFSRYIYIFQALSTDPVCSTILNSASLLYSMFERAFPTNVKSKFLISEILTHSLILSLTLFPFYLLLRLLKQFKYFASSITAFISTFHLFIPFVNNLNDNFNFSNILSYISSSSLQKN